MSRKYFVPTVMATALIAVSLSTTGCKKEEKAPESAAPAKQEAAPSKEAAAPAGPMAYDFESGNAGWLGSDKSVKIDKSADNKHGGSDSLKISGTAGAGKWNFAVSPKVKLEPGKKYKITGWMFVKEWDKKDFPPLLKVAVNQDSKWVSNAFTKKYELNKSNEWQQIGTIFETPKDGNIDGYLALEKGTQDPIKATIYLDDVKIAPAE